jgi:two-component system sensor histidine kinase MtrB
VLVTVADRGPGVPPDALGRLFDRFYKADPSRSSGSSGIGLAIAAEHAALLGGSLRAEAREGGGLVFRLHLPVTNSLPGGDGAVTGDVEGGGVPGPTITPAVSRERP